MIGRLWRRQGAHEGVVAAEEQLREVRAKGDEITALSRWAKERREQNHLTELFYAGRPRGSQG